MRAPSFVSGISDLAPKNESRWCVRISGHVDQAKGVLGMKTRKHTVEQIIAKLRQAEVELAEGSTIP